MCGAYTSSHVQMKCGHGHVFVASVSVESTNLHQRWNGDSNRCATLPNRGLNRLDASLNTINSLPTLQIHWPHFIRTWLLVYASLIKFSGSVDFYLRWTCWNEDAISSKNIGSNTTFSITFFYSNKLARVSKKIYIKFNQKLILQQNEKRNQEIDEP